MLDEDKLIEAVRAHQELYDTNHVNYTKATAKVKIWSEIARELGLKNGEAVKTRWLKLRGGYRDARRRHRLALKNGAESIKPWKFERQLSFLEPYMLSGSFDSPLPFKQEPWESENGESPDSNDDDDDNDDDEGDNADDDSKPCTPNSDPLILPKRIRKDSNDISSISTRSTLEQPEVREREKRKRVFVGRKNTGDPLFHFFMSMYQLTKNMSEQYQHRVRAKVFQAVSDAEAEILNVSLDRPASAMSFGSSISEFDTGSPTLQDPP